MNDQFTDLFDAPERSTTLLDDARDQFQKDIRTKEGGVCPCCDRFGKIYKRRVTSSMAYLLVKAYSKYGRLSFHLYRDFQRIPQALRSDFCSFRHWRIIEAVVGEATPGAKSAATYQLTNIGKSYVEGIAKVPKYLLTYNNEAVGFEGEPESIIEALSRGGFNYWEMMNRTPGGED